MGVLAASTLMLAVLFIQGCSAADHPPDARDAAPARTVFDPVTRDIDKARAVQGTVDAQAAATRRALDAQERGDSPQ